MEIGPDKKTRIIIWGRVWFRVIRTQGTLIHTFIGYRLYYTFSSNMFVPSVIELTFDE